jgi:hypothetical protein
MQILQETSNQLVLQSKIVFGLLGSTSYTFDKSNGTLKINGRGLFGSKPKEYPLAGITGAVLQEQSETSAERAVSDAHTYRIELVRQDGSKLPLTFAYTSGKAAKEQLVEKLRQFLLSASRASPQSRANL